MPPGEVIGQVMESNHPIASPGDYVRFMGGWQEYSVALGDDVIKIEPEQAPLSAHLGVLGMPGLTAWASIIQLARVQARQTVLVSAALGPVGSTVGQIAMQLGATAVGLAGSDEKCRLVTEETGFATCLNYKSDDYPDSLRAAVPNGVDIYHDNVGGQILIDAINVMNDYGTVVLCGLISQYNDASAAVNLPVALPIMKRLTMKGLVVYDYNDKRQEFMEMVAPWVQDGSIKFIEDRATDMVSIGGHFARLMRGENIGKSLVVLGPEKI
jgi:NADPH-dependent curcumin reductase CurA